MLRSEARLRIIITVANLEPLRRLLEIALRATIRMVDTFVLGWPALINRQVPSRQLPVRRLRSNLPRGQNTPALVVRLCANKRSDAQIRR